MADLKAFRKANKLTQQDIAEYLGVGKTFICQIETGKNQLPKKQLERLLSNTRGWDVTLLSEPIAGLFSELDLGTTTADTPEQPTEDVVVISTQVLEEMSAQRQLTEQALALVQEQLEAKQETIEAVREQLATTQEQLTTSQEHLTTSQEQLSTSQEQLSAEQQQVAEEKETTRALLEDIKAGRQQMQAVIDRESKQQEEFFMMLHNQEQHFKREMRRMEERMESLMEEVKQSQQSQKPTQPQLSKSKTDN